MKFKHIDLHPTNPIFKEQFTVELRPKGKRPIDVTQLLDVNSGPTAVSPRTHQQDVEAIRAVVFDRSIDLQRSIQVLGIEPAANGHHGRRDVV